jgi:hypothetical protein
MYMFLLCSIFFAQAEEPSKPVDSIKEVEAPFGLEWGIFEKDFKAKGIVASCETSGSLISCKASVVPQSVSVADNYLLVLDSKSGLQKVVMIGKTIDGDLYGSQGKLAYQSIKSNIEKKYSSPKSFEYVGRELYRDSDEFYQCLAYDGCGQWVSFWSVGDDKGGSVALYLNGLSRGQGYIRLGYESKDWGLVVDRINTERENKDASAF